MNGMNRNIAPVDGQVSPSAPKTYRKNRNNSSRKVQHHDRAQEKLDRLEICQRVALVSTAAISSALIGQGFLHGLPASAAMDSYNQQVMALYKTLPPLPESPSVIDAPSSFEVEKPKIYREVLKNKVRLILLEDHEVPMVRGVVSIRGGNRLAPASNPALAALSASVQRSSGTRDHQRDAFDDILEELSARIEGVAASDALTFGFSCLKDDSSTVIGLLSDLLTDRNQLYIDDQKLRFAKLQLLNALAHKNDNPSSVPLRELEKIIYSKDSVYVVEPTEEQIVNTSAADVVSWITAFERPDETVIGVVGDFKSQEMAKLLRKHFEEWTVESTNKVTFPNPGIPDQRGVQGNVYVIQQDGLTQSTVAVGEPGIQFGDPDEIELGIFSQMINSFGGSLFDEIRSKSGLAYTVSAGIGSTPVDHVGLFIASAETDKPVDLLEKLFKSLDNGTKTIPSKEELRRAQEETLNSFVFSVSSLENQLRRSVIFETFGIDEDYLYTYMDKVRNTTPERVQQAVQRHIHPKTMTTVIICGDSRKIAKDLRERFPDRNIIDSYSIS